jgi:DNA-directed RNA polymerase specialized sigma24 family protein
MMLSDNPLASWYSRRLFGGLRTSDVATVLGKSEGAVKMLVHRAVTALRDCSTWEDWR